jgi:flagellar protein FliS
MDGSLKSYETVDVLGKSQLELVIKVYDGALASLRAGAEYYKDEKLQEGYEHLEKAKTFVVHLYTTLDVEQGGEVAVNLSKLYSFIVSQIDVIEATKDLAILDDIISVLTNLKSGWSELKQQEANVAPKASASASAPVTGGGFAISG